MSAEILIIDDNSDIREILKDLITDAGYSARLAANYSQALSEIDKKLPNVAVLDVKLSNTENNEMIVILFKIIPYKNFHISCKFACSCSRNWFQQLFSWQYLGQLDGLLQQVCMKVNFSFGQDFLLSH